jgi:hypothetical protein
LGDLAHLGQQPQPHRHALLQPPRRRTIMRGGFGQLGDSLTEAELAPA